MDNTKLTKEMQDAIDNYGSQIKTLQDFVSAVRKRPTMYIGLLYNEGFLNMIREIFQNAVDQLIDPMSPCNYIKIIYNMQTLEVTVSDNGLGLPFNDMIRILTKQHTSKNYEKVKFQYSSGLNGVGSKVVNALSETFIAESYKYDGTAVKLEMKNGYPTTKDPVEIPNKEKAQGTLIKFIPSREIMGENLDLDWNIVYKLVKRIISLTPIGSTVDFEAIDIEGQLHQEHIINTDGIITDLIMKSANPFIKPIVFGEDNGELKLDAAIVFSTEDGGGTSPDVDVTAFSNYCPTISGTHIDGFVKGIESWFVSYMNKIYLTAKNNKTKVIGVDIDNGLKVMISAACLEPLFTGQSKENLSNPEMLQFAKQVAINGLEEWSKSNPQDLNKLCKYFKNIADIRMSAEKEKAKIVEKFDKTFTGYPAKYVRPEGKEHLELIICEGDSAKGTIMDGRCKKRQGVFPIRGKMPNAFRTTYQKFMANAEVQGINNIILDRKPYRKNYDPIKDVMWEKIILGSDADIDGAHIDAIILRFMLLYHPQLIQAGKLYRAVPPLFGVRQGKNKMQYFTERMDIVRYIQKEFTKQNSVKTAEGKDISSKDLSATLALNIDYTYEVDRIANTYAIDPCLLELVLVNKINDKSPAFLKKEIKSKYRFMDSKIDGDEMLIEGTLGDSYNTLYLNDQLISECKEIIKILNENTEIYYNLNGTNVPLYTFMKTFEDSSPKNIQRYKGLGEMDYQQLSESTIHPDGQRTLIQYTIQDVKEEIESIRRYESNMKLILNEVGNVTRTELLG